MENILEQLTDLKIQNKENEFNQNLKNTGIVSINTNWFVSESSSLFSKLKNVPVRTIDENESEILLQSNQIDSSESDKLTIGSSLQLISDIISQKFDNGFVFMHNSSIQDITNLITEITIAVHGLKRIMILDLDKNSDSKIQNKFYQSPKVLYNSIHQYIDGVTAEEKQFSFIGDDQGKGFNINITMDEDCFGESEYMATFFNIILPVAYEFNPEIIFIPFNKQESKLTSSFFGHLIHLLSSLANGKIFLIIDETESSEYFKKSVNELVGSMLGLPCKKLKSLREPASSSILKSLSVLRPHWCCLQLLNDDDESISLNEFLDIQKNDFKIPKRGSKSKNFERTLRSDLKLDDIKTRTCVSSDLEMMKHFNLIQLDHPEKPDRIKRILETLKEKKLYYRCKELKSRYATDQEINLCHSLNYIEKIKSVKFKSETELKDLSINNYSVFFNSSTFDCAMLATGCLLQVVDEVCSNRSLNGVGIIRPPGHHAYYKSCSGFCFFNSVAIGAKYAQKKYNHIKKILILDFDVHHGNGTQDIFLEDDTVLFISLHRYDNGTFYPIDAGSNYDEVGKGKGKGFNINIPWNQSVAGDAEYTAAFLRIVMPVAYEFNPDLVLVSAGFDGATGDPLGRYNITPSGFAQMTKMLCSLANGKVILGLEGGYNLLSISESMASCVSILLGDRCPSIPPINAKPKAYESIRNVIKTHKKYWSCLKFDVAGDAEYTAAFLRIVMPVAYEFNPDLVLVSAGFDGATGDPLGRYNITPSGFAQMTKMLCSLANGKVILGLEGGYNLLSISESMASCVSILLGDRCPSIPPINAKPKAYESIRNVIKTHKKYWSCLKFDEKLPNCEFVKKFKPERKQKNNTATENSYTLRSRNKPKENEIVEQEQLKISEAISNIPEIPSELSDEANDLDLLSAFSVIPLTFCPHLSELNSNLDQRLIDVNIPCFKCNSIKENWICLSCFECGCSRFVNEHMLEHHDSTHHPMVLSFSDLSVWCYICESYVHNDMLTQVKQMAYKSKFG
uniref:Protein deacetylase HDAC6 n=1 Tax=Brachionus koreanus TaxID=1199090 RepID=A0A4Y6ES89_9BILA|nr:histone deacetylase 6 isoform X2 [Brachionus koreanus]